MTRFLARPLEGARLRTPAGIRLIAGPAQRDDTARGHRVLPRRGDRRRPREVGADTAALIERLRKPARLATHSISPTAVARLVLDGLLEAEIDGRFVSGAEAHRSLFPGGPLAAPRGRIARLSHAAIMTAASLDGATPPLLADRLYRYNTKPRSPEWCRRLGSPARLHRFLRLETTETRRRSRASWREFRTGPWRVWEATTGAMTSTGAVTWKLYVSPVAEHTGEAMRAVRSRIGRADGPFSLKVGCTMQGVLRPDRLVAYFRSRDALMATARWLRGELDGLEAEGVPFTAPLVADGLLSWGIDLPRSSDLSTLRMERSWRGWLTIRLADHLVTARTARADDPGTFACDRLSLDGVRTTSWTPMPSLVRELDGAAGDHGAH